MEIWNHLKMHALEAEMFFIGESALVDILDFDDSICIDLYKAVYSSIIIQNLN